jgi:hypothetical protein
MKNAEVIRKFVQGDTQGKGSNLYINNNNLVNYSTIIARRINGKIYLNNTKYSQTTSRIQNMIRNITPARLLVEVNHNDILRIDQIIKVA